MRLGYLPTEHNYTKKLPGFNEAEAHAPRILLCTP